MACSPTQSADPSHAPSRMLTYLHQHERNRMAAIVIWNSLYNITEIVSSIISLCFLAPLAMSIYVYEQVNYILTFIISLCVFYSQRIYLHVLFSLCFLVKVLEEVIGLSNYVISCLHYSHINTLHRKDLPDSIYQFRFAS